MACSICCPEPNGDSEAVAGDLRSFVYSWALLDISEQRSGHRWTLLRRNDTTGELGYYLCYSPVPASLPQLIWMAGRRWKIEDHSKRRRARPVWISTKSERGRPGTAGPSW